MAKVKIQTINSLAEFEQKIDVCAQLETDQRLLSAELDKKILELKENYGGEIESIKKQVKALCSECGLYAAAHPELFSKNKSAETALAKYGFRTGNPTVKTIGKLKESDAIESLLNVGGERYIVTKHTLDKSAIREGLERGVVFLKALFKVVQDEGFFIEAKIDKAK